MDQNLMLYAGAVALGALHAFEPGHGKTIIAAYMIGSRGRAIDGILLGIIVTFTHTFSVLVLGVIARLLSHSYTEKQLHGWLGLFSALLILIVGIWMLRQRLKHPSGHTHVHLFGSGHHHPHDTPHTLDHKLHDHGHNHDHDHHHHEADAHRHGHDHHPAGDHHTNTNCTPSPQEPYNKWNLMLLGISGGLVPCPAAIATLLAAIAAGKIAQGLTLAIFFSAGLGIVMMTIGVILSQAGRLTKKIDDNKEFSRWMGIASAAIITILGAVTLFHSVQTLWF